MNKALLIFATLAVLLLASAESAKNHKRADCATGALLADPYFSLSASWNTNAACPVVGETKTCSIPGDDVFSGASTWRNNGPIEVSNVGRESLDRWSARLLESSSIESDFSFPTESPYCALRWQDFTTEDVSYSYTVDILDSNGNSLGQGFFPDTLNTDSEIACDFSGCNFDARNILGWTLPAAGTYTVRFTGVATAEGAGALINDICIACMAPSPSSSSTISISRTPSSSISQSASSSISQSSSSSISVSRTPSSSISQSPSSSISQSPSSSISVSRTPSSSISQSPSSSISQSPSSSISVSRTPSSSISQSPSSSISQSASSSISQSASSSISQSASSSISQSASSSISQSASSSISQSPSSSISQSASSSISQSSSASPSSSPIPSPCPSRSASPSPCPEPSPEPCDPCARKHKHHDHDGGVTININFSCGGK